MIDAIVDDTEAPEDACLPREMDAAPDEMPAPANTQIVINQQGETVVAQTIEEAANPDTGKVESPEGQAVATPSPDAWHRC